MNRSTITVRIAVFAGAAMQCEPEPYRHYHSWASGNGDLYPESVTGGSR